MQDPPTWMTLSYKENYLVFLQYYNQITYINISLEILIFIALFSALRAILLKYRCPGTLTYLLSFYLASSIIVEFNVLNLPCTLTVDEGVMVDCPVKVK
jgi:hypothetical protein